ncbi:cysteine desulfurase [Patescibacteria group bacterium]|nr:cysteine desulfurase [Patescibacteria group bacterium]MBU3999809.1 cysteine desulfurase [Patescibacteria group bacterium]MBU4056811.1 cysteine desulfurase [Patescibacteria group bacterium]MBU4368528.1 cysteine desulfurase [Patescibacteria group bacterium]
MPKKRIYLDNAATTPVDPAVLKEMMPYFSKKFGNPFSVHSFGQEAKVAIDNAREQVAKFLGCSAEEIFFTSGATESNNWTVNGILKSVKQSLIAQKTGSQFSPHLIISAIEHHCVLNSSLAAQKAGVKLTVIRPKRNGAVSVNDVASAIGENTVLISIMYVNNEVGTIQPIKEIGEVVKRVKSERAKNGSKLPIYFHTDAVQAANYLNCKVDYLGVDLLTLSAHKIYGPKGIGCLYIRRGIKIGPSQYGGEQESNLRAGTHNVPGIAGLGKAIALIEKHKKSLPKMKKLRDKLINEALKIESSQLNGSRELRTPNNANFSFKGVEGESLIISLDMTGIAASTGSACSSASLEPSHVLTAMGIPAEIAHSSLRLTLGKDTTERDINYVIKTLPPIIERLRKISGRK